MVADIIRGRREHGKHGGSLVDIVLGGVHQYPRIAELLRAITTTDGRLIEHPPFIGYLFFHECVALSTSLSEITVQPKFRRVDQELLLRILDVAVENHLGLVYVTAE